MARGLRTRWGQRAVAVALALGLASVAHLAAQSPSGRRARRDVERAERFLASGDLGSAMSLYRRAIQSHPAGREGYLGLARTYRARGDLGEARVVLEAGARRLPGSAELALALLDLRLELGERELAAAELRALLRRFPERAALWRRHGQLAQEAGRFSEALAAYRTVLDLVARGVDVAAEDRQAAEALVPALVLLVGDRDPVAHCGPTAVREALCARGR